MSSSTDADRVVVHAPATSANLGPGFDSLGVALGLENEFVFERMADGESYVTVLPGDGAEKKGQEQQEYSVPIDSNNLAIRAFNSVFDEAGITPPPVHVTTVDCIPIARGMGSSASAIVAGIMAADVFSGRRMDIQYRLNLAARLEGHPDNSAACILGGVTASALVGSQVLWARVNLPKKLWAAVAVPDYQVPTESARNVLPRTVTHSDAVFNVSRAALTVASLSSGAYENLRYSMDDRLHQPYRSPLVPGLLNTIRAAQDGGAIGAYMSGAGPSVLAFVESPEDGKRVASAMTDALSNARVTASSYVLPIIDDGAYVSEE